jgi:Fic family protein
MDDIEFDNEALEAIDQQYQLIPSFSEWSINDVDADLWRETETLLFTTRENLTESDLAAAREKVMRAAAITTGALEDLYAADRGFTITVAEQASAWQQGVEERGPRTLDLFKAQMMAYDSALDAATRRKPISQAWMRSLHEILTEPQETYIVQTVAGPQEQPLPRGRYKIYPNHVALPDGSYHAYAPVSETQIEMTRFTDELNSQEFNSAHPILQCSYAHYALAAIHPFADGNGRVVRAVASVWLLRAISVPLVIFTEEKREYLRSLRQADEGNHQAFVDFVGEHAADSVMLTLEMIERSKVPALEKSVAELQSLLTFRGSIGHEQMDQFAEFLVEALSIEVASVSGDFSLPSGVQFSAGISQGGFNVPPIPGFRPTGGMQSKGLQMSLSVTRLPRANAYFQVYGYVSTDRDDPFPLALGNDTEPLMRFRISEVRDGITAAARHRVHSLAEQLMGRLVSLVEEKLRVELGQAGYRVDE